MPDQLENLAHTCALARDRALFRCATIERTSRGYAHQTTIVRALRYSSLTCLMYNNKKRTELIHFVTSNFYVAFGFACHNDDLELAKYLCQMCPPTVTFLDTAEMISHAVPMSPSTTHVQPHLYSESYNNTSCYTILRHICEHGFEISVIPESRDITMTIRQADIIIDAAIRSGYVLFVQHIADKFISFTPSPSPNTIYEQHDISPDMREFLRAFSWSEEYIEKLPRHSAQYDMIANTHSVKCLDIVHMAHDIDRDLMFALAIMKNNIGLASAIINKYFISIERIHFSYLYILMMYPDRIRRAINGRIRVQMVQYSRGTNNYMSISTSKKLAISKNVMLMRSIEHEFDEMLFNATDEQYVRSRLQRVYVSARELPIRQIHSQLKVLYDHVVRPASSQTSQFINAQIQRLARRPRIMFIAGMCLGDIDIMRKSRFVLDLEKDGHLAMLKFIMSARYARIYDTSDILAHIGASGIFDGKPAFLMSMSSTNAISIVMRNMSTNSLIKARDYLSSQTVSACAKTVVVECVLLAIIWERRRIALRAIA